MASSASFWLRHWSEGQGRRGCWKFQQQNVVLLVSREKNQISPVLASPRNVLEKSPKWPRPGKNYSDAHELAQIEFSYFVLNKSKILLRAESLSNMCAKLRDHSIIACSHHIYVVFFFTHIPFVVNRAFQRNASGEVATTSPPFYNEPHRSHVLCVKAEPGTTFTSWSQHHFVAIG